MIITTKPLDKLSDEQLWKDYDYYIIMKDNANKSIDRYKGPTADKIWNEYQLADKLAIATKDEIDRRGLIR